MVAGMVGQMHLLRSVAGVRGPPLVDYTQVLRLRADGRDPGGRYDLAARENGRGSGTGIWLLLGAGRHVHAGCPDGRRVIDKAQAWREWLLRAVAGTPSQLNIMYGLAGERRLTELELSWLPGYQDSRPVRIGNAAHQQFQLDVFGEVMDALGAAPTGFRRGRCMALAAGDPGRLSRSGRSRTKASGKSAGRGGISPIPRSWPGRHSIGA